MIVGASIGAGIGYGVHYGLQAFWKVTPLTSLLTTIAGLAGIGAAFGAYKFSADEEKRLDNLYQVIEVDISSFMYALRRSDDKMRTYKVINKALKRVRNFIKRHMP